MYFLIDEIIVPTRHEKKLLDNIDNFRRLYFKVPGITQVKYLKTTLEAFTKPGVNVDKPGAANLTTVDNPAGSYLLLIAFESKQKFQDYHDNSTLSKQIHQKISSYFDDRQLTIRAALHGNEI